MHASDEEIKRMRARANSFSDRLRGRKDRNRESVPPAQHSMIIKSVIPSLNDFRKISDKMAEQQACRDSEDRTESGAKFKGESALHHLFANF
jgi:hypothetical protein